MAVFRVQASNRNVPKWQRTTAKVINWLAEQALGPAETGVCWDDIQGPVFSFFGGGVKDPDFVKVADDGSGSTGVYLWAFDKTVEQELFGEKQFPHTYKEGTNFVPHIHWAPTDTDTGNVVWGMELLGPTNVGDTFPATTTMLTSTSAADGTAMKHQIASFGERSGTNVAISAVSSARIFRDAGNASDTYDNDAVLLYVDWHIQKDTRGSAQQFIKTPA